MIGELLRNEIWLILQPLISLIFEIMLVCCYKPLEIQDVTPQHYLQ